MKACCFGFSGLLCVLFVAAGCTAKCRELESAAELTESLRDTVDDRLEPADVSDVQRAKVQAMFAQIMPARMQFRRETVPLLQQLVSELRRDPPDRKRQAAVIVQLMDAGERYAHIVADTMLEAHPVLTPEQRKKLAAKASEPSEPFDGSWLLDRGIDLLVMRVEANAAQEALIRRVKQHFVQQAAALQRKADALRAEAAAELSKDKPDATRLHAMLKRGRGEVERFMFELAGYEQLVASKLGVRQRALLNAELVRIQACPEQQPKSATSGAAEAKAQGTLSSL